MEPGSGRKRVAVITQVLPAEYPRSTPDGAIAVFRKATKQHHVVSIFVSTLETPNTSSVRGCISTGCISTCAPRFSTFLTMRTLAARERSRDRVNASYNPSLVVWVSASIAPKRCPGGFLRRKRKSRIDNQGEFEPGAAQQHGTLIQYVRAD